MFLFNVRKLTLVDQSSYITAKNKKVLLGLKP